MKTKSKVKPWFAVMLALGGFGLAGHGADQGLPAPKPGTATTNAAPGRPAASSPSRPAGALVNFRPGGGRGSVVRLAVLPEVQEDLEMTAAQKENASIVAARLKAFEAGFAEELQHPPVAPPGSGIERQWVAGKQNLVNQALAQARLDLARALSPPQVQRLEQLAIQELGGEALFRPEIARQLNLTPPQRQALLRIRGGEPAGGSPPAPLPSTTAPNRPAAASSGYSASVRPPTVDPRNSTGTRPGTSVPGTVPPAGRATSPGTGPGAAGATAPGISGDSERRMIDEVLTLQQRTTLQEIQGRPLHFRSSPEEVWKQRQ